MNKSSNQSENSWAITFFALIHKYIVDIFGILIPGSVALFCVAILARVNQPFLEVVMPASKNDAIKIFSWEKYSLEVISTSSRELSDWLIFNESNWLVVLILAYVIGFLFHRRTLQLPDAVSQMVKALNETYRSYSLTFFIYSLVCCIGSMQRFVMKFQNTIYKICDACTRMKKQDKWMQMLKRKLEEGELPHSEQKKMENYLKRNDIMDSNGRRLKKIEFIHNESKNEILKLARKRWWLLFVVFLLFPPLFIFDIKWNILIYTVILLIAIAFIIKNKNKFKKIIKLNRKYIKERMSWKRMYSYRISFVNNRFALFRCIKNFIADSFFVYGIIFLMIIFICVLFCMINSFFINESSLILFLFIEMLLGIVILLFMINKFDKIRRKIWGMPELLWKDCSFKQDLINGDSVICCDKNLFNKCRILKAKTTRYPYEDFFDVYLTSRDCPWLMKYGWKRLKDSYGNTTIYMKQANIRYIESMKLRSYYANYESMNEIRRIEAHIRMSASLWYISRLLIIVTVFMIYLIILIFIIQNLDIRYFSDFIQKINEYIYYKFSGIKILSVFTKNVILLIIFCFVNYSIASFFHYLRLKEVHHILEIFNIIERDCLVSKRILYSSDFKR